MGKIIRNGVEYSGAVDMATAVSYDGSVSGLSAQTVQEAIDEVSESLDKFRLAEYDELVTLTTVGQTYTIQEDCMIAFSMYYASPKEAVKDLVTINGCVVLYNNLSVGYYNYMSQPIRCFKDDVISIGFLSADSCRVYKK